MVVYTLEQRWEILRLIDLQKMAILAKEKNAFSDEAHFDFGGFVNKQNSRIWGTENPHAYIEKPTYPKRVTVWCGFWCRGIIGPFFFENEQGEAVTVNGDRYRAVLNKFLFTKIEVEYVGNIWFQQDGATCNTAEATLEVLRPISEDRIISNRASAVLAPRSYDLTPLDYYLWGAIKDKSVTPTNVTLKNVLVPANITLNFYSPDLDDAILLLLLNNFFLRII